MSKVLEERWRRRAAPYLHLLWSDHHGPGARRLQGGARGAGGRGAVTRPGPGHIALLGNTRGLKSSEDETIYIDHCPTVLALITVYD